MRDLPPPRSPRRGEPSFAQLLDWVEGRLDEPAAREVAAAVEHGDAATRESVEWIRAFHAAAAEMPLEDPPPEVSARLRDVFDRLQSPSAGGAWSEARPGHGPHDDRGLPRAAGFRSVDQGSETTHLFFHTEIGDLLLRVAPSGRGTVDVDGRVLVTDTDPARGAVEVAVLAEGVLHGAARCGLQDGGFVLRGLPRDVDEVWLTRDDRRVRAAVDLHAL